MTTTEMKRLLPFFLFPLLLLAQQQVQIVSGVLTLNPAANNVNFAYCPGVTETPAAATINWRVVR